MSQTQQIRKHLNSGRPLTALQALDKFGCFRLAARINDLRHEYGKESILTEMQTKNGKTYAVYHGALALKEW